MKKTISIILLIMILLMPVTVKAESILGDADGNGSVDIADATVIQRHLVYIPVNSFNENAADTDEDHEVTIVDVTFLQRWLSDIKSNDNIGKPLNPSAQQYLKDHARKTADKISALQNSGTLTFGVITDSHVQSSGNYEAKTKRSIDSAAYALSSVGKAVDMDFVANLGDNQWENDIDSDKARSALDYFNNAIENVFGEYLSFRVPGNHDQSFSFGKVYQYVGAYNSFDETGATYERGHGYKDLNDKKIRIICLNTSDYYRHVGGYGMSYEQKEFLMNALDMSSKKDFRDWKIILLSHIPLDCPGGDYNTYADVKAILDAYVSGGNVTITVNSDYAAAENESLSGSLSHSYSGKNSAKIIANIHGHIHNHSFGRMADNDIVRICAPNTCFAQNASASSYGGGMYDTSVSYPKVLDTANETAVTFFVIDPDKEEISAIVYGAGFDRTVSFADIEPTVKPFTQTVSDLMTGSRAYWMAGTSGYVKSDISLAPGNACVALGASTANGFSFINREDRKQYLIPVPDKATKITVKSTDPALDKVSFRGIKLDESRYIQVLNSGWQTSFSQRFELNSVDYFAVSLLRSDEKNVDWDYPVSNIAVYFNNQ